MVCICQMLEFGTPMKIGIDPTIDQEWERIMEG